jgi:hypothetical protein
MFIPLSHHSSYVVWSLYARWSALLQYQVSKDQNNADYSTALVAWGTKGKLMSNLCIGMNKCIQLELSHLGHSNRAALSFVRLFIVAFCLRWHRSYSSRPNGCLNMRTPMLSGSKNLYLLLNHIWFISSVDSAREPRGRAFLPTPSLLGQHQTQPCASTYGRQ